MENKEVVIIVSGWGTGNLVWDEVVLELEKKYSVHILNPNYKPEDVELENLIDEFYQKNNIEKANVIGWSMGSMLLLEYLVKKPERVKKCILISGTLRFTCKIDENYTHGWPMKVVDRMIDKLSIDKESVLTAFYKNFFYGELSEKEGQMLEMLQDSDEKASLDMLNLKAGLELLNHKDLRQEISKIKKEILLIHGEHDNISPIMNARYLDHENDLIRLKVIENSGHLPFISDYRGTISEITNHLEGYYDR